MNCKTLGWGCLLLAAACAHVPGLPGDAATAAGRIYDGNEAQLKDQIYRWFHGQGIELEVAPHDPHALVSRTKETNVGIVKGEARAPTVTGPATAAKGDVSAPESADAEAERVRTASLEQTARSGAREFHEQLAAPGLTNVKASGDPALYDKWGVDRAAYVERDWWEVHFEPVGVKQTRVIIFRNHASDWGGSADKSYFVGASALGHKESNVTAPFLVNRDLPREQALAEFLDYSAAVEVAGQDVVKNVEPAVVAAAAPPAAAVEPGTSQPTAATVENCGPALSDGDFGPGEVLLLADPEGTDEGVTQFNQLVCRMLARGLPVTVALSMSASEQGSINRWLESQGTKADKTTLLAGSFWGRIWQDGRSSQAMFRLLEDLRARRSRGQNVAVLASDVDLRGNPRTAFISARILEHTRQNQGRLIIGFFSNTLSSQRLGSAWDKDYLPVGYRLASAGLKVSSFDVSFKTGYQWSCRLFRGGALRCGSWVLNPGPKQWVLNAAPGLNKFSTLSAEGFDGLWFIGKVSASLPALEGQFKDEGDLTQNRLAPPKPMNPNEPSLF